MVPVRRNNRQRKYYGTYMYECKNSRGDKVQSRSFREKKVQLYVTERQKVVDLESQFVLIVSPILC